MPPRHTRQRAAIRRAMHGADRPLTIHELRRAARRDAPGLGIATVYRNVKRLVQEGWLVAIELPGDKPRYERSELEHHHHFRCTSCHRVYAVAGCDGRMRFRVPPGFHVERHDIVLYGTCDRCDAQS